MPQVPPNKRFDCKTEIENISFDFNTLCYPEESINICNTSDESERKSYFSTDISDYESLVTDLSP